MAPTDPAGRPGLDASAPDGRGPAGAPPSGEEPLTADLGTRTPRLSTRALVRAVGVVALLVLVAGVVALVLLHQPRLTPVPVPSVSSIG